MMSNIGRPRKSEEEKTKPTDLVKCPVCPKSFYRNNRTYHNRSKTHQIYATMDENLRRIMLSTTTPPKSIVDGIILEGAVKNLQDKIKLPE